MNKQTEYMRGREDGLDLALRIVQEGGIPALVDEMRYRNVTGINTSLAKKDLEKALKIIKKDCYDIMLTLCIAALHDEFRFGEVRLQRFLDMLDKGADFMQDDLATLLDYKKAIEEEIGLHLEIWDEMEKVNR